MKNNLKLTGDQAAFILNVSRQTIYNMQERGALPAIVDDSAIAAYIKEGEAKLLKARERLAFVRGQ